MTDRELMQQALNALEEACEIVGNAWSWRDEQGRPTITALHTRLAQPEHKPVAWLHMLTVDGELFPKPTLVPRSDQDIPLYTTAPPHREWQGLTDEEIYLRTNHIDRGERGWAVKFAHAIEAKLKEKNYG